MNFVRNGLTPTINEPIRFSFESNSQPIPIRGMEYICTRARRYFIFVQRSIVIQYRSNGEQRNNSVRPRTYESILDRGKEQYGVDTVKERGQQEGKQEALHYTFR